MNEFSVNSPSRHSNGTFNNKYIFGFGVNIHFFKSFRSITFESCHENTSHLYSRSSQFHKMSNIFTRRNPTGGNHRNMFLFFIVGRNRHYFRDQYIQGKILILQLFLFKSQMPASFGSFNYYRIRQIVIILLPFITDYSGSSRRRYDRYQFRYALRNQI